METAQICMDLTKGVWIFSQSALNLLLSQWSYSIWSARQRNRDPECAVKETSAALNASSCEAGSVWAAGAVNIHGKAEESLNAAEQWKNVQASKITRRLSWSRYRSVNDGATGFPWWPYMAPASALRKGSYAWQLVSFFPAISLGLIKDITPSCSQGLLYSPYTANLVKGGLKRPCCAWYEASGKAGGSHPAASHKLGGVCLV